MIVTIVPKFPKEIYEVYKRDPSVWDSETLTFSVNVSPSGKFWRLVYWNGIVKDLFESGGTTCTINHLFWGTEKQCLAEIDRLKLKYEDIEDAEV
jgi:hypothetical protein